MQFRAVQGPGRRTTSVRALCHDKLLSLGERPSATCRSYLREKACERHLRHVALMSDMAMLLRWTIGTAGCRGDREGRFLRRGSRPSLSARRLHAEASHTQEGAVGCIHGTSVPPCPESISRSCDNDNHHYRTVSQFPRRRGLRSIGREHRRHGSSLDAERRLGNSLVACPVVEPMRNSSRSLISTSA